MNGQDKGDKMKCTWIRNEIDHHFDISCVNETHQRGNKQFKSFSGSSQWDFKYCPWCGKEIEIKTELN